MTGLSDIIYISFDIPLICFLLDVIPKDTKCVTVVDIVKIKPNKSGWYYLTCYKCPKQCFGDAPPYRCVDKHETETEIIRYIFNNLIFYRFCSIDLFYIINLELEVQNGY